MSKAYLKFNVRLLAGAGAGPWLTDPIIGGVSVIESWRVVSGTGALLSEEQHYSNLVTIHHLNNTVSSRETNGQCTEASAAAPLTALASSNPAGILAVFGTVVPAAGFLGITHKPVCPFFNADKLMPLGYTAGTVYLSITLAPVAEPLTMVAGGAAGVLWDTFGWELHVPILRPGNEFAQNFRTLLASGMPINIHSVGFQNSQQNIAQGTTGAITSTFSTRKRSVKSLMTCFRRADTFVSEVCNACSGLKCLGITNFNYTVGGIRVPSAPINANTAAGAVNIGEVYMEQKKAIGHYDSDLEGTLSNITQYMQVVDTLTSSRCVFAVDLESYDEGISGKNLSGQGLPLVLNATLGVGATNAATLAAIVADLWVVHDVIYQLDGINGTLTASS